MNKLSVRQASKEDIDQLVDINKIYYKGNLHLDQLKNGFIGFLYDENDFLNIINQEEITVACQDSKVVGYYLVNSHCHKDNHQNQIRVVNNLKQNGLWKNTDRVAIGSQAIIEIGFQGIGLSKQLLKKLIECIGHRYEYFFSCVSKINEKAYSVHTKEGWVTVDEDDTHYYVSLKINQNEI